MGGSYTQKSDAPAAVRESAQTPGLFDCDIAATHDARKRCSAGLAAAAWLGLAPRSVILLGLQHVHSVHDGTDGTGNILAETRVVVGPSFGCEVFVHASLLIDIAWLLSTVVQETANKRIDKINKAALCMGNA
jgi:hypothetical protein